MHIAKIWDNACTYYPVYLFQALGSQAPIVPTKILGDPVELDRHLIENGYAEAFAHPPSNYTSPYIYTGQHTDIQLHVSCRSTYPVYEIKVIEKLFQILQYFNNTDTTQISVLNK